MHRMMSTRVKSTLSPKETALPEPSKSDVEPLARAVGLTIDPIRLPILEADYAVALAMIEDLHSVETELVPDSPFDPSWPTTGDDEQ